MNTRFLVNGHVATVDLVREYGDEVGISNLVNLANALLAEFQQAGRFVVLKPDNNCETLVMYGRKSILEPVVTKFQLQIVGKLDDYFE